MSTQCRGVSRPLYRGRCRGWLAQNKAAKLWRLGFRTQKQARDWLAAKLGVAPMSLKRSAASGRQGGTLTSKYRGVWGRSTTQGGVSWYVRIKSRHHPGAFDSELAAARFLSKATGSTAKAIRKTTTCTRKRTRDQFAAAYRVFKKYNPGDLVTTKELENSVAMKKELHGMFRVSGLGRHNHSSGSWSYGTWHWY